MYIKYKIRTFGQRSFVVIYFKVTVLKNSLIINSLDVVSPASKRELRVNLLRAVRMEEGSLAPRTSCSRIPVSAAGTCRSELVDLPLQVLQHGVHALRRAPDLLQHFTLPLVGLLQLHLHVTAHEGFRFFQHLERTTSGELARVHVCKHWLSLSLNLWRQLSILSYYLLKLGYQTFCHNTRQARDRAGG